MNTILISSTQFDKIDEKIGQCLGGIDFSEQYRRCGIFSGLVEIHCKDELDDTNGEDFWYSFEFDTEENLVNFQMKFL